MRVEGNGGGRHRLGESALDSGRECVEEGDADWERAHLIWWEWCGEERFRLGESALDSVSGVGERDADWERAHFRVGRNELRRMMSTGRERT